MNLLTPDKWYNLELANHIIYSCGPDDWLKVGHMPEVASQISLGQQSTEANLGTANDCIVISPRDSKATM